MLQFLETLRSALFGESPESVETRSLIETRELDGLLDERVKLLRQGDILGQIKQIPVAWLQGADLSTPLGVVIVSQTCDAVRQERAELQVCPVVELEGDVAANARSGRAPRYAVLPAVGSSIFADLSVVATIHKNNALDSESAPGVDPEEFRQVADFSRAVGRRFDRFAFPDAVVDRIRPLQDVLRRRAGSENSALFRPLAQIVELRLEAIGGWRTEPPYDLVLIVVVKQGLLPDPDSVVISGLESDKTPTQEASTMPPVGASLQEVQDFWERFADSLAKHCKAGRGSSEEDKDTVAGITGEAISEDDLKYNRVRRSAEIDLDHLSPPAPE